MAVARLEGEAMRLERQGEKEEAVNLRARANKMRYEDPYTALQDELDEAIKNEVKKSRPPPSSVLRFRTFQIRSMSFYPWQGLGSKYFAVQIREIARRRGAFALFRTSWVFPKGCSDCRRRSSERDRQQSAPQSA